MPRGNRRVGELAPAMNQTIAAARARGILIIHAPSSCMDAYKDHPGEKPSGSEGRESAPAHRRVVQQDLRPRKKESIRSTSPTAVATTARSVPRAHPGNPRSRRF